MSSPKNKHHISLVFYQLISVTLITLISATALIYFYYTLRSMQQQQVFKQYDAICSNMEQEFTASFKEAENICNPIGTDPDLQNYLLTRSTERSDSESYQLARKAFSYAAFQASALATGQVFFYSNTGRYLISDENYTPFFKAVVERSNLDTNARITWSYISIVLDKELQQRYLVFVFPYRSLVGSSEPGESAADMVYGMFLVDPNTLIGDIPSLYETDKVTMISNQHLLASSKSLSSDEMELAQNLIEGRHICSTGSGETYMTAKTKISKYGYSLIYMVPQSTVEEDLLGLKYTAVFISLLMFLISVLISFSYLRFTRKGLRQLLFDIEKAGTEETRIHDSRFREFSSIASSINRMLDSIDSIQAAKQSAEQALLQAEIDRQNAQMMAYRSQINPHFLFNALETMRSMAQYVEEVPLTKMIISLSSMLRHILYTDSFTTLAKEASSLSDYIEIIQIRFSGKYRFILDLAPETRRCRCLCMMLQPFAENSIKYAFTGYSKKAVPTIYVRSHLDETNNRLIVDIIDNGNGISPERLEEIERDFHSKQDTVPQGKDFSIGLANVYQRLKLAYGSHCHLKLTSSYGHYTRIRIEIPQE